MHPITRNTCFPVCAFVDLELEYCESQKLLWTAVGTTNETILLEYIWSLVKHSWLKWSAYSSHKLK